MARVALVVGASSGLGAEVAARLAKDGFLTYAGARSFAGAKAPPEGCRPVALDVTDDASVHGAIARVLQEAGRLDALVNCAAFLTLGACEECSMDELRAVMETNFMGMARVTQAALPLMRAQGQGRIVQFSSLNGLLATPFQGAYTASKHAIEGWNEALAMETLPFGIQVTLLEPGDCKNGAGTYRKTAKASQSELSPYSLRYRLAAARIHRDEANGMHPRKVARAVSRTLQKRRAPARVVVARPDQRLAMVLHDLLPGRLFFRILSLYYFWGARKAQRRG